MILSMIWSTQHQQYEVCLNLVKFGWTCRFGGFSVACNNRTNNGTQYYAIVLDQEWKLLQGLPVTIGEWKVRVFWHWMRRLSEIQVMYRTEEHDRDVWDVVVVANAMISEFRPVKYYSPGPSC